MSEHGPLVDQALKRLEQQNPPLGTVRAYDGTQPHEVERKLNEALRKANEDLLSGDSSAYAQCVNAMSNWIEGQMQRPCALEDFQWE